MKYRIVKDEVDVYQHPKYFNMTQQYGLLWSQISDKVLNEWFNVWYNIESNV